MNYIGIDLGTSSVKLLLVNEKGEILNSVSKEYPISFPKSVWSEQSPDDWWNMTLKGLEELIVNQDAEKITGISFGGQMHGLVTLDKNDDVIRPAILWNDGRSTKECDYLNIEIGQDVISKYTGNISFAGFTAPKILWMKNNEPENFKKISKIMLPKDYIAYKLTGVFSTDVSDASGMLLLDVKRRVWSKEMLEICGINENMLPKIFESYQKTGNVKSEIAKKLGLKEDVVVAAGAGDNAAAAVGTGTVGENSCNISVGTSGTVFIATNEFGVDEKNSLHSFAHSDGKYHLMGCMLSAASCNKWWVEDILKSNDYNEEQKEIEKNQDKLLGENNVFFIPYLMGERSPHNAPHARGGFIGISMDTTRTMMTQSVLEGVAFALRDSVEVAKERGINFDKSKICGGGAKSTLWKKIIANVLNLKLEVVEVEEGPALGAALLAAVACGEYETVEEAASSIVNVIETVIPEKNLVEKYEKKYQKFKKIFPACDELFKELLK